MIQQELTEQTEFCLGKWIVLWLACRARGCILTLLGDDMRQFNREEHEVVL